MKPLITCLMWLLGAVLGGTALAQSTTPGSKLRDCPDCPEMVAVPGGSFVMGVLPQEEGREGLQELMRGWAVPLHQVTVPPFLLGKTGVTRGQFAAFVRKTGRSMATSCTGFNTGGKFAEMQGRSWREPGFQQEDDHPVVCVSWEDAKAYAEWLARETGKRYRLPSEAEWEYAARAGSTTSRPWGDLPAAACENENVADQALRDSSWMFAKLPVHRCRDGFVYTAPVGIFRANAFGLQDMMGNAGAWVEDCWNVPYKNAPTDGSAWRTGDCGRRVGRGGSWLSTPRLLRSGFRQASEIGFRSNALGFRVARDN